MPTLRRDVLTGAAGLAAGGALFHAPALAQAEPFRIEPSADFLKMRSLVSLNAGYEAARNRVASALPPQPFVCGCHPGAERLVQRRRGT